MACPTPLPRGAPSDSKQESRLSRFQLLQIFIVLKVLFYTPAVVAPALPTHMYAKLSSRLRVFDNVSMADYGRIFSTVAACAFSLCSYSLLLHRRSTSLCSLISHIASFIDVRMTLTSQLALLGLLFVYALGKNRCIFIL